MTEADFIALLLRTHQCTRFKLDELGRCVFCAMNAELATKTPRHRVMPFDVPGYYVRTEEPNVVVVPLDEATAGPTS